MPLQFYLASIPNHPKSSPDMWHFPILTLTIPSTISAIYDEYLGASSERNWLNNASRPHLSNLKFLQLFMVVSVKTTNHRFSANPRTQIISDLGWFLLQKNPETQETLLIEKMQACLPRSFARDTPQRLTQERERDKAKKWIIWNHWHQNILRGSIHRYRFFLLALHVYSACGGCIDLWSIQYMYVFMVGLHSYQFNIKKW